MHNTSGTVRVLARIISRSALLVCLLWIASAPLCAQQEKRLSVYTPETSYALPVLDRGETAYVGLLEVLEPMGTVSAHQDGKKWKFKFNDREAQFTLLKTRAKVRGRELELAAPFLIENGRGLVPLHSLASILSAILPGSTAVNLHEPGRRLFIGGAEQRCAATFTKSAPGRLELTFSSPVNPFVATEPGKLRLLFSREPVFSKTETLHFPDALIASVAYAEHNGTAEINVTGSAPLMATFSEDRKTITITAMATPAAAANHQAPQQAPAVPANNGQRTAPAAAQPERPRFLVVIDASHGGDDHGAALSGTIAEKDVTLAFARRLARELDTRGIAARLLRDSDTNIGYEQRANAANAAGASLFISFHASSAGSGLRVYTASLTPAARPAQFLPWETAQAAKLQVSQSVAENLVTELLKHDFPTLNLKASVRPLNNVAAPAVAIEVAPPSSHGVDELNAAAFQQSICGTIASAVVSLRPKLQPGGVLH